MFELESPGKGHTLFRVFHFWLSTVGCPLLCMQEKGNAACGLFGENIFLN